MPKAYGEANEGSRPVKSYSPPKFEADDPEMLRYLDEHGYVVVGAAANAEAITRAHDDFWQFHEALSIDSDGGLVDDGCEEVKRDDPRTWGRDFLPHPTTGIITGCGCARAKR